MYSYEVPSNTECMVAVVKFVSYTECPVSEDINGPTTYIVGSIFMLAAE